MKRRNLLWPPLRDLELWNDLANAIDEVWKDKIDNPQKALLLLRDTYPYVFTEYDQEEESGYFDRNDLYPFEKEEYMLVCDMLGFKFNATFFEREDYQLISSNFASYLPFRATSECVDYFSYCLSASFDAEQLWAEIDVNNKYVNFTRESDMDFSVQIPVFLGGTWFPTTHVALAYDFVKFGLFTPYSVRDFFNYVVPLGIVLGVIFFDGVVPVQQTNIAIQGQLTVSY